jgi:hypothetical protein
LTLNLGLRYEIEKRGYDRQDLMSNFVPGLGKLIFASDEISGFDALIAGANLSGYSGVANEYGLPRRGLVKTPYTNFAPRVGLAFRVNQGTVIRGGYGIFYAGQFLNDVQNGLSDNFPFVLRYTFNRSASDPSLMTLANPYNPALGRAFGVSEARGVNVGPVSPYMQSYNLTVEKNVGGGAAVEVAYVGSKATHLARQTNINVPRITAETYMDTGTGPRPFPYFGNILYWDYGSNSVYNAGQVTLRKRAAGSGAFYRLSYTYSKSIDNSSQPSARAAGGFAQALDATNLRLERARSDWDRGHVFTGSYSLPLPVGRGRRLLSNAGRIVDGFLGGWLASGTASFSTGPPFTVLDSAVNVNVGESQRPNRVASGMDVSGAGRRGVDHRWFDPSAFVPVPGCRSRTDCSPDQYGFSPFRPGNSARNILDAPGVQNLNLAVTKRFTIGEEKFVQFRWETFNLFNHPNFLVPNINFDQPTAGYINRIVASGQGGRRIVQLSLRFQF